MPDRAITYARVSTDAQSDEGSSLATQRDRCLAYCHEQNYLFVEHHEDTHTGSRYRERPGLTALRAAVRAGLCDVVVCHAIDRLSRNQAHLYVLAEELEDAGVRLEFVTESFADSAVGRLLRSVSAFVSEVEREKIVERTSRGKLARLQSGRMLIPRLPMYGYAPNADRTGYVVNPETAPIVQRIYRMAVEGHTIRSIARELMDAGVPAPAGGTQWSPSTIATMLHVPAYRGAAYALYGRGKGRVTWDFSDALLMPDGTVPRLVDDATWYAVQERLRRNREAAARNTRDPIATLLRGGIARCGGCGRALSVRQHPRASRDLSAWRHYSCPHYNNVAYRCESPVNMSAANLDTQVWDAIVRLINTPELLIPGRHDPRAAETTTREQARLDRRLRDLTRRRQNLTRELSEMDDADAAAAIRGALVEVSGQLRDAEGERTALDAAAASHASAASDARSLATWARAMQPRLPDMGAAERRMVVEMLSLTITVHPRGHHPRWEMTFQPPVL